MSSAIILSRPLCKLTAWFGDQVKCFGIEARLYITHGLMGLKTHVYGTAKVVADEEKKRKNLNPTNYIRKAQTNEQ